MVTFKSPGGGLLPCDLNKIIGKVAKKEIIKDESILLKHVNNKPLFLKKLLEQELGQGRLF